MSVPETGGDPRGISQGRTGEMSQRVTAITVIVCAILDAALVVFVPWRPRADFDVIGILWIMQNIVPFTAVCIVSAIGVGALATWVTTRVNPRQS